MRRLTVAAMLALLALAPGAGTAPAGAPSTWDDWEALRFTARSGSFFSGKLEMFRSSAAGTTTFRTVSVARFLGMRVARSETVSQIDTATGRSRSLVSYSKDRGRRYRFLDRSYVVERIVAKGGSGEATDEWSVSYSNEYPYPLDDEGKPLPVYDYYGMLLYLRRVALERPGDEVLLQVATSKGPAPFRVVIGESRERELTLRDMQDGDKRQLTVREFRLRIIPDDPARADEGFLKMEGETEMWVEARSKTLLALSGNAPKIPGRIELTLGGMGGGD